MSSWILSYIIYTLYHSLYPAPFTQPQDKSLMSEYSSSEDSTPSKLGGGQTKVTLFMSHAQSYFLTEELEAAGVQ